MQDAGVYFIWFKSRSSFVIGNLCYIYEFYCLQDLTVYKLLLLILKYLAVHLHVKFTTSVELVSIYSRRQLLASLMTSKVTWIFSFGLKIGHTAFTQSIFVFHTLQVLLDFLRFHHDCLEHKFCYYLLFLASATVIQPLASRYQFARLRGWFYWQLFLHRTHWQIGYGAV